MEINLGSARHRAVLARLLMPAGVPHPVTKIINAVWGETLPGHPRNLVHKYVGGLRRALEPDSGQSRVSNLLPLTPDGYILQVDPEQNDLEIFSRSIPEAMSLVNSAPQAAGERLRSTLALWKGEPFGQLPGEFFAIERLRIAEHRLAALEDRIGIDIALGRHAEVAIELVSLVFENPLREHLATLLMIALYRSGRQADALNVFRESRRRLVEELGIEPGHELKTVHQLVLAGEPVTRIALSCGTATGHVPLSRDCLTITPAPKPASVPAPAGPPAPVPAELPGPPCNLRRDIVDFTGRESEVAWIRAALIEPASTPPVVIITGMAGVGKSALATHVAYLVKDHFAGGQLYLDLKGMSTNPVEPAKSLLRLLRLFGVAGPETGDATDDELGGLYRASLRGPVLTVLDDVSDECQVRPLLTGEARCATLITSRFRLAGLEGAYSVELGALDEREALEMLTRIIGQRRIDSDADSSRRILRFAEGLPLAIRGAGARLVARPHWSPRTLADRLADERRRLDEFTHNDLDVCARFAHTLHRLSAQHAEAFRLLGSGPNAEFTATTAAGLLGLPEDDTEDIIEQLVDARLVRVVIAEKTGRPKYRLPGLVYLFARGLSSRRPSSPLERRTVPVLGRSDAQPDATACKRNANPRSGAYSVSRPIR